MTTMTLSFQVPVPDVKRLPLLFAAIAQILGAIPMNATLIVRGGALIMGGWSLAMASVMSVVISMTGPANASSAILTFASAVVGMLLLGFYEFTKGNGRRVRQQYE